MRILKSQISQMTNMENKEQEAQVQKLNAMHNVPSEMDRMLAQHNTVEMLQSVERSIKTAQYNLFRVIRDGTGHFIQLQTTTADEYNARINGKK